MTAALRVAIGQATDPGPKEINQDFHGAMVPTDHSLTSKGVALAVADGISSSRVSGEAAQAAIKSFLGDYYCTSDAWSVKTSAHRVLAAANSWLHAQNRRSEFRYDMDRGWVCAFSALVLKSATAHALHVGDGRIHRFARGSLEQLTTDHRTYVTAEQSFLSRALGVNHHVEIDYLSVPLEVGDVFLLATDGICGHLTAATVAAALAECGDDLDRAARRLIDGALQGGADDNLTLQIVRIDALPAGDADEAASRAEDLPPPPAVEPPADFDGWRLLRTLHANSRSRVFLAHDPLSGRSAALKFPPTEHEGDPGGLKRLMMEEWIARRLHSPHVLAPFVRARPPKHLYAAMEYVDGQSLTQWMRDNPEPKLDEARALVGQIAAGLRAFHRKEMLHRDLRPDNVLIDRNGTAKIIDFGSVRVAGVAEQAPRAHEDGVPGAVQYAAPEYFLGETPGPWSDVFSLGVMTYQMLSGRLPYGVEVARVRSRRDLARLTYAPLSVRSRSFPSWLDEVLFKAVHPDPAKRYDDVEDFIFDLRNAQEDKRKRRPLIERNPLLFWKLLCAALALLNLVAFRLLLK